MHLLGNFKKSLKKQGNENKEEVRKSGPGMAELSS